MEPLKMYLRIKRESRVFFFECSLLDPVEILKRKLLPYYKQEIQDMRIYMGDRLLDDKANLQDQAIPNDSCLMLKLRKGMSAEWDD
ncbi:unnamed protein product [Paramecium pentaurelia]|uniref:Ubiquitin-like domain-containing protein n=1 Tax=Paramecium pentaurelia TaxID=43138 RepID=A0A8S1XYR8_9CILI|nr:unnamed protein product [Paramecium pentaurelia]